MSKFKLICYVVAIKEARKFQALCQVAPNTAINGVVIVVRNESTLA